MRSDNRDRFDQGRAQRQLVIGILQKDDALFGDLPRVLAALERIHDAVLRGVVPHADGEHAAQNPMHGVVDLGEGHVAALHRGLQRIAEEPAAGLLLIQAGHDGLLGAVSPAPIR